MLMTTPYLLARGNNLNKQAKYDDYTYHTYLDAIVFGDLRHEPLHQALHFEVGRRGHRLWGVVLNAGRPGWHSSSGALQTAA